jgi:hypothetical protein
MRDTVELLEAIGRDANLRHASPEELAKALKEADASKGLLEMVNHGDSTALTAELGLVHMHVEHQSQTGGHEGDEHPHHPHHPPHPHHPDHPKHDDDDGGDKEDKAAPRSDEPKDAPAG